MSTRVISALKSQTLQSALNGSRVLVTGLSSPAGLGLMRAFAAAGCRLVVHMVEQGAVTDSLLDTLRDDGITFHALHEPLTSNDAGVRLAQAAAAVYGGIDYAVNLIEAPKACLAPSATPEDIQDVVSATLGPACLITKVAANRMKTTWIQGSILNVLMADAAANSAEATMHAMLRQALTAITRGEARARAADGIRINALVSVSDADCLDDAFAMPVSEADIPALALQLASDKCKSLSGLVFDSNELLNRAEMSRA